MSATVKRRSAHGEDLNDSGTLLANKLYFDEKTPVIPIDMHTGKCHKACIHTSMNKFIIELSMCQWGLRPRETTHRIKGNH